VGTDAPVVEDGYPSTLVAVDTVGSPTVELPARKAIGLVGIVTVRLVVRFAAAAEVDIGIRRYPVALRRFEETTAL